jgi:hypothetical protein
MQWPVLLQWTCPFSLSMREFSRYAIDAPEHVVIDLVALGWKLKLSRRHVVKRNHSRILHQMLFACTITLFSSQSLHVELVLLALVWAVPFHVLLKLCLVKMSVFFVQH